MRETRRAKRFLNDVIVIPSAVEGQPQRARSRRSLDTLGMTGARDRLAPALSALTFTLHMAVAGRYDLFRDELYFIVCGRHPAFGYADQPPLVPLVAAGMYALGGQTWLVRLPSALAAAALVWLTVALVRLLGGRTSAALFAGIAAGFAPILLGLTATLNTTTFEPLA